jgi:hypothetical protein
MRVTDRPAYCPQVKAVLSPGNYIIFKNDNTMFDCDEQEDLSIGLIMKTEGNGSKVEVNLFQRVTPLVVKDLRLPTFTHPRHKWIPKVIRTERCHWINAASITTIAWVFQSHLMEPNEGHQGMSNLYLLTHNDWGDLIGSNDCYPFCSYYAMYNSFFSDCCYPERVWNGLQNLRSEISRHLGRFSEKQGSFTKVSSLVVIGSEAWQFLLSRVESRVGAPVGRNSWIQKRVLEPGLLLKSNSKGYYSTMIRFETEDELHCLSSVLGELVTVDVRKRRPRYGVVESLHLNDVINIIAGSAEREVPFKNRTNQQGVDLIYDGTDRVRIRLRYQRYQYCVPLVTPSTILERAIKRKKPLAAAEGSDSSDDDSSNDATVVVVATAGTAKIGREFEFLNRLFRVQSIDTDGQTVNAKVFWPLLDNTEVLQFDLEQVERLIAHRQHESLVH